MNTQRTGRSVLETLETRRLFSVPVEIAPKVLEAQFSDERSPHQIRVQFNEDVGASIGSDDLLLYCQTARIEIPENAASVTWDDLTYTATFTFHRLENQTLPEGTWTATLRAEGITDSQGLALDGDNNNTAGGDYAFEFFFLRGDANHDGRVDVRDYNIVAANFGQADATFSKGDFDYDGLVGASDATIVINNFGVIAERPNTPAEKSESASALFGSKPIAEQKDEAALLLE